MLACDGCGAIVSERPDEEDPTATWYCLTVGPVIGGGMAMLATIDVDDALLAEPEEHDLLPPPEPPRHFCTLGCLRVWTERTGAAS